MFVRFLCVSYLNLFRPCVVVIFITEELSFELLKYGYWTRWQIVWSNILNCFHSLCTLFNYAPFYVWNCLKNFESHNCIFKCCHMFTPNFRGGFVFLIYDTRAGSSWKKNVQYIWTAKTITLHLSNSSVRPSILNILIIKYSIPLIFTRVQTLEGFHVWSPAACSLQVLT